MRKIVKIGILLGAMILGLSGCYRKTELYEPSDEVIADSGFDVKKDAFPFVNYNVYREEELAKGQCFGMSMVTQLYYRGLLPYSQGEVEERRLDGIIGGEKISGEAYDLSNLYGNDITADGYLKNNIPLSERFQSVGYELITNKEGKWQRSASNPDILVLSDERRSQITDDQLYITTMKAAPEGAIWNSGDGKAFKQYEEILLTPDKLNHVSGVYTVEGIPQKYELLCMINHWHATQDMEMYQEIDVLTTTTKGTNPQKKNFDKLVEAINKGIPVVMSCEDHAVNAIRIEKSKNDPMQYALIVSDSNYPGTEKTILINVKKKDKKAELDLNVLYLNNEQLYEFYDYYGGFGMAGANLKPKFYYLDNPPVTPYVTAEATMPPAQSVEIKLSADMKVGDEVLFGRYEQDNNFENGSEEIIWKVISVEDGKALLLSKDCLDGAKFHESYSTITWKDCILRSWLNQEFYNTAFNDSEKVYILTSLLTNEKDDRFNNAFDGEDTEDKVFLLSKNEVEKYLSVEERCANATEYAKSKGVSTGWGNLLTHWWIRTAAWGNMKYGFYISNGAWSQQDVDDVKSVRPAIWVELGK